MFLCPYCRSAERQVKSGFNRTGTQRIQCQPCRRQYTPQPRPLGWDGETRAAAIRLYLEGNGVRRIGRLLGVNHQSVANWINLLRAQLRVGRAKAGRAAAPASPPRLKANHKKANRK